VSLAKRRQRAAW